MFDRKEAEVAQLRQLTQADLAAFLQARPHRHSAETLLDHSPLRELSFCLNSQMSL